MGTNYYAYSDKCDKCGRADEEYHIGKSSVGWRFLFEFNGLSYKEILNEIENRSLIIKDEYGREISLKEFKKLVEEKQICEPRKEVDITNIDGYEFARYEFS